MNLNMGRQSLQDEVSCKRICRFCLSTNQPSNRLQNIFARQNSFGSQGSAVRATLPIQIMAIASIEVSMGDGLPPYICRECLRCFEYSYQFKRMCKKAEHLLRQVPLTGSWPEQLQRPTMIKSEQSTMSLRSNNNNNNNNGSNTKSSSTPSMDTNVDKKSSQVVIINGNGNGALRWSGGDGKQPSSTESAEIRSYPRNRNVVNSKSNEDVRLPTANETRIILNHNNQQQQQQQNPLPPPPPQQQQQKQKQGKNKAATKRMMAEETTATTTMMMVPKKILNTTSAAIQQQTKPNSIAITSSSNNNNNNNSNNNNEGLVTHLNLSETTNNSQICGNNNNNDDDDDEATRNFLTKIENDSELLLDDLQRLIEANDMNLSHEKEESNVKGTTTTTPMTNTGICLNGVNRPKLLNKASVRILNKEADKDLEPRLSVPKIKQDEAGNVEIVAEILDVGEPYEHEPDPKDAVPIEVNVFPCPKCERSFPLQQLRDLHLENHKRTRNHCCEVCSKSFYTKYDLQKHVVTHSCEKPYKCTACDKSFARSNLLYRHEKTHTEVPKFICVHCERPFLTAESLEKHLERHNKRRPYQCKLCHKAFAFKQGLERHEVLHSREQPYPCQYCKMSFSTTSKLARHLTAHAGERPYPCKMCPKSYLLSHHFTRHLRSHKNDMAFGAVQFQCTKCNDHFPTQNELIEHSMIVHTLDNLICPICNEEATDNVSLKEHLNLHSSGEIFPCEFCDFMFMTAEKLQAHTLTQHAADVKAYCDDDDAKQQALRDAAELLSKDNGGRRPKGGGDRKKTNNNSVKQNLNTSLNTGKQNLHPSSLLFNEEPILTGYVDAIDAELSKLFQDTAENFYVEPETGELKLEEPTVSSQSLINLQNVSEEPRILNQIIIRNGIQTTNTIQSTMSGLIKQEKEDTNNLISGEKSNILENGVQQHSSPVKRICQEDTTNIIQVDNGLRHPPTTNIGTRSNRSLNANAQILKSLPQGITVRKTQRTTKVAATATATTTTATTSIANSVAKATSNRVVTRNSYPHAPLKRGATGDVATSAPTAKRTLNAAMNENSKDGLGQDIEMRIKNARREAGDSDVLRIGEKRVKVQKIMVTKSEAAALAKEGRIQYKDGNMILRGGSPALKRALGK